MTGKLRIYLALLLILLATITAVAVEVPPLQHRVNDTAAMLAENERAALESLLADYESKTTNQLAVLTIPTLGGEDLSDFANRAYRTYRLGQQGKDNGILLLIARDDRKMRIEVGYGLEGVLPDGRAGQIIRYALRPYFQQQNYYAGIDAAVREMMRVTNPDYQPPVSNIPRVIRQPRPQRPAPISPLVILGVLGAIGLAVAGASALKRRCPRCHKFTKTYTDQVIEPATFYSSGINRRDEYCTNCGYHRAYDYATSANGGFFIGGGGGWGSGGGWGGGSSSGGGDYGGFSGGGGSSGGGGASGDW